MKSCCLSLCLHTAALLLASHSISGPFVHATCPAPSPRSFGGSNAGAAARGHDGTVRVKPWSGQEEREELCAGLHRQEKLISAQRVPAVTALTGGDVSAAAGMQPAGAAQHGRVHGDDDEEEEEEAEHLG